MGILPVTRDEDRLLVDHHHHAPTRLEQRQEHRQVLLGQGGVAVQRVKGGASRALGYEHLQKNKEETQGRVRE